LTESALPLATRRARRQRRLSQRLTGSPFITEARYRQIGSGLAIIIAIAIGITPFLTRGASRPVSDDAELDAVAYNAEDLRPTLGPADVAGIPMPAAFTVEQGDTLLSVAFRFGSTVEAIRIANNLSDTDTLSLGQALVIPPPRSVLHPVDPALPSADIAEAFEVDAAIFAAYNGMAPDAINEPIAREVAVLPSAVLGIPAEQLAEPARVEIAPAVTVDPGADGTVTYTVSEGDTILAIAQKLGVEVETLVTANQISDSDLIVVGDALAVPLWSRPAREASPSVASGPSEAVEATGASISVGDQVDQAIERPSAPFTYELEPGDTLQDVAWKFGVDVYTLMNNNDLRDADMVRVGTQLTILPVSGLLYKVERGDTLEGIARAFKVDLGPVIDFNYLEDADSIPVGKELILPGGVPLPPPPPPPTLPTTYTVGPGDTVAGIARYFGVGSDDIVAANGLRSADSLSVGQNLRIAEGAAAIAAASRPAAAAPAAASAQRSAPAAVAPAQRAAPAAAAPAAAAPARAAPAAQPVTRNLPVPAQQAAAAEPASAGPSSASGSIVSIAMQYVGARYVFGGTTPAGFDCSGFVYYVMNRAGKGMSRGMWGQYGAGSHPSRGALQPGDIVFFQNTYMPGLSHNGIYIGGGQFIHASDERSGVKISGMGEAYWASRYFGATRP
jgi:cell wall-associated NlpC family hydrolase/nucleoid-associated protein YgaU